jgi:hypothetical protein
VKSNSAPRRNACLTLAILSLAGCAASDELSSLRYRVLELETRLSDNSHLIADLKEKTNKFDLLADNDNLCVGSVAAVSRSGQSAAPPLYPAAKLSDLNFWKSSGGRHSGAVGNKEYLLTVAEVGSASIMLISEGANTYLHLFDGAGEEVSKDDDSAEGNNALIQVRLYPGNYIVVASTFEEGVSASFALTVLGIDGQLTRL